MKVCILEDKVQNVRDLYSPLIKMEHDVHLVFFDYGVRYGRQLQKMGFLDHIHVGSYLMEKLPVVQVPKADLYLSGKINGMYLDFAQIIGKDRFFINSSDKQLIEEARKEGCNIVDGSLEDLLESFEEEMIDKIISEVENQK